MNLSDEDRKLIIAALREVALGNWHDAEAYYETAGKGFEREAQAWRTKAVRAFALASELDARKVEL